MGTLNPIQSFPTVWRRIVSLKDKTRQDKEEKRQKEHKKTKERQAEIKECQYNALILVALFVLNSCTNNMVPSTQMHQCPGNLKFPEEEMLTENYF